MQKVRAGVVGVGQMGQYHVGVYSELFNVELVGVADCDQDRVTAIAEKYKTIPVTDYHELLGAVDVVSIAVPTSLHYRIARDFLEAGVHVLLEKPMTHTWRRHANSFASQRLRMSSYMLAMSNASMGQCRS